MVSNVLAPQKKAFYFLCILANDSYTKAEKHNTEHLHFNNLCEMDRIIFTRTYWLLKKLSDREIKNK